MARPTSTIGPALIRFSIPPPCIIISGLRQAHRLTLPPTIIISSSFCSSISRPNRIPCKPLSVLLVAAWLRSQEYGHLLTWPRTAKKRTRLPRIIHLLASCRHHSPPSMVLLVNTSIRRLEKYSHPWPLAYPTTRRMCGPIYIVASTDQPQQLLRI